MSGSLALPFPSSLGSSVEVKWERCVNISVSQLSIIVNYSRSEPTVR